MPKALEALPNTFTMWRMLAIPITKHSTALYKVKKSYRINKKHCNANRSGGLYVCAGYYG